MWPGEGGADAGRLDVRAALDHAAGPAEPAGDLLEAQRTLVAVVVRGAVEHAVVAVAHLVALDLPDRGGALLQLAADVHRRLVGGPAGGEGGAAAAGVAGEADRVRVRRHRGVHVRGLEAERLRERHRERRPLPADVDRAGDEADRAVGVDVGVGAGLVAAVEPEAHRDAASAVLALQLGAVVLAVADLLHHLFRADRAEGGAVRAARALDSAVHEPQVHRVQLEPRGQLVQQRLDRELRGRRAGRAVGGDLRLVQHDVPGLDELVGDVVRAEGAARAGDVGGAGVGARLVGEVALGGDNRAVVLRADP